MVDLIERTHKSAANTPTANTAGEPHHGPHDGAEATSDHHERQELTHEIKTSRYRRPTDIKTHGIAR